MTTRSRASVAVPACLAALLAAGPVVAESDVLPRELLSPWYLDVGPHLDDAVPQRVPGPGVATGPDRDGLRRDTYYFLGYQFAVIAILYAAPESVSSWTDEQKDEYSLSKWWDNVTNPSFDSDDLYINYLLHPYWGATYYVRAKERGYPDLKAFQYSFLLSALYEFGAEALFEEPSIQDLFLTPALGAPIGQYFMHVRDGIRERELATGRLRTRDRWALVLTDPLGTLNRQFDRWFGWGDAAVHVQPYYLQRSPADTRPQGAVAGRSEREYGIRFHIAWR